MISRWEQIMKEGENDKKNRIYMAKKTIEKAEKELETEKDKVMIGILKRKIEQAEEKIEEIEKTLGK